jgi:hypothetical protein
MMYGQMRVGRCVMQDQQIASGLQLTQGEIADYDERLCNGKCR